MVKSLGFGERGWIKFIDNNFFNPLVKLDYTVKDLFANHEDFKDEKNASIVGSYHGYGCPFPRSDKHELPITPKQRAMNFCDNSLYVWNQRAKLIENRHETR